MSKEHAAEQEFLGMLIKVCRTIRTPKNKTHRVELSIPAAKWEILFSNRASELKRLESKK